jgi:hypothetical protein
MDCFVMGRSCACRSKYRWVEQWRWKDLLARYEEWRRQITEMDGGQTGKAPLPLDEEHKSRSKKTLAHVCQEQLKIRPWVNVKQSENNRDGEQSGEEIIVNDDGTVKKTKKKPSKTTKNCHSCCHRHPKWMMVECTMCERGWCYGVLWRAYDLHPLTIMEDVQWECPHCHRICSVGACRKDPRQQPYEPKGTLLGHDTKKIADVRSIECLVDFSKANLIYLGESVDGSINNNGMRLQRRQWEAEMARQNDMGMLDSDRYADDHDDQVHYEDDVIDPALGQGSVSEWQASQTTFGDSAMENGDALSGHISAFPEQEPSKGFEAPSAVMYRSSQEMELDGQAVQTTFSKKRQQPDGEQIKLVSSKKRKVTGEERPQPKNKANKQYLLAYENKRLEQARKDGRYIQVLASIKGRKRIVKLNIDGEKLRQLISRPPAGSRQNIPPSPAQNVLIQSDIPSQTSSTNKCAADSSPRASKKFRVRVEDDRDFRGEKRTQAKSKYEDIEIESDSDFGQDTAGGQLQQKRRSEWRSRKHRDDEGLPDELPENFKDGSVNPRQRERERERESDRTERRQTIPATMKVPKTKPAAIRASTGGLAEGSSSGTPNSGKKRGRPSKADARARTVELARAVMSEEENGNVNLMTARIRDDNEEGEDIESFGNDDSVANGGFTRANGSGRDRLTSIRKSIITNKAGPSRRKIKIVGKKNALQTLEIPNDESERSAESIPSQLPSKKKRPPRRRTLPNSAT